MQQPLRSTLRRVVAYCLYFSGLLWLYAAIRLRHRVVVLMYHRVLPSGADSFSEQSIIVTPGTFSRQLGFLRRHFRPLSIEQLEYELQSGRPLPSCGCVITFDDGWYDNVEHAMPVLQRYAFPATVFLATDYVGTADCFWQERLARLMFAAANGDAPLRELVEKHTNTRLDVLPPAEQRRAIRAAVTAIKKWTPAEVTRFETDLRTATAEAGITTGERGDDRFMSWHDVERLTPPSTLAAGSHGCSHAPLTRQTPTDLANELKSAKEQVETVTRHTVKAIAYPNGDYDDTVVELTRRAGYTLGFTTRRGLVSAGDDPLRLRRLNVSEASSSTLPEFMCIILGVFDKWPSSV